MNKPLVSVIVPVYNVEKYLRKCLDSIINQTYKNLEIILVDDGSPDNCGKICDECALKDKRVKVIHKTNGGQSSARNMGLDIAKGEYIAFVDSDDWIDEGMYEELVCIAQKETTDIVISGFYKVEKDGISLFKKNLDTSSKDKVLQQFFTDWYPSYLYNQFYKAKLFKNLKFTAIKFEDLFIMPSLILRAKKIFFTPKAYYYYNRMNENSTTSLLINPVNEYGTFRAWAERERLAKSNYMNAYSLCQKKAIKYSIRTLCLDFVFCTLSHKEAEICKNYLRQKRCEQLIAYINPKYKFLWWSIEKCPLFGKLYGKYIVFKKARKGEK
ncbi:MAG: glycosyltransferase family 2 protein [Campylobacteraceae bacterium]|jgi:glycosyltransferase involved in cell wall biosynthesis|nr:glycosyltransferase family 2 protein [Campylobacteraceae bacterium]